jgi:uncharacterized protein (TIGR03085 family)
MNDRPPSMASRERAELCDTLERLGPSAPTLCEGWQTRDLAAHLYVRERDPVGGPGIVLPGPFQALTRRRMRVAARLGYERLVAAVRRNPPLYWRLAPDAVQHVEFLIHHEDARRANGEPPRELGPEVDDAIWRWLGGAGRLYARSVPCGLVVRRRNGAARTIATGSPEVTLVGEPMELLLFLTGRTSAAHIELEGDPETIEAVRAAGFGV